LSILSDTSEHLTCGAWHLMKRYRYSYATKKREDAQPNCKIA